MSTDFSTSCRPSGSRRPSWTTVCRCVVLAGWWAGCPALPAEGWQPDPQTPGGFALAVPRGSGLLDPPEVGAGQVVQAWVEAADGFSRTPLPIVIDPSSGRVAVEAPASGGEVIVETAERTAQTADGRICLSPLDALVAGENAKLETQPGNHRIGFWTDADDAVSWKFAFTRWGRYEVELTYSLAGDLSNEVEARVGPVAAAGTLESTGSWYRYRTISLGRVPVDREGPQEIGVRCRALRGPAVMNLKAVVLRPAPEGEALRQLADGTVVLKARDAVVHGTRLRYEPAAGKDCLGYWTEPGDRAEWRFSLAMPGRYAVQIVQGCGSGSGGSEVDLVIDGQALPFVVEDTGHFQNWLARRLGEVEISDRGMVRLELVPRAKTGVAIMDVREVRLLPLGLR